ncbi:MAG: tetratricopeptide repeat protein [Thermodesulfobacteriota bacterium]
MAKKRILLRKKKDIEASWLTGFFAGSTSGNRKSFLTFVISASVLIILFVSGYIYYKSSEENTLKAFTKGMVLYNNVKSAEGVSKTTKDYEKTVTLFKEVVSSYPKSKVMPLAYLFLGDIYYQTGEYDDALNSYSHILKGDYDDNDIKTIALYSTGKTLESMGKLDEAIKQYEEIEQENADGFLKALVLMDLGRLYEKQNRPAESLDRLREFLTVSPDSILVDKVRYRISILEGQAEN